MYISADFRLSHISWTKYLKEKYFESKLSKMCSSEVVLLVQGELLGFRMCVCIPIFFNQTNSQSFYISNELS